MSLQLRGTGFFCHLFIDGHIFDALVDTGADITNLSEEECRRLNLRLVGGRQILCVHGDASQFPLYEATVDLAGKTTKEVVLAMPKALLMGGTEIRALLGRSSLANSKLEMNWSSRKGRIKRGPRFKFWLPFRRQPR